MLFGVGGLVMAAGGKACGWFALVHAWIASAPLMNVKSMLAGRQPGELGRDYQASGAIVKGHRPELPTGTSGTDRAYRGHSGRRLGCPYPCLKETCHRSDDHD